MKNYFLEVDLAHLIAYDEELANYLKFKPAEYLPLVSFRYAAVFAQSELQGSRDS